MHPLMKSLLPALVSLLLCAQTQAANWANWRGPNYDGSTDEKNLPAAFSKTNNVKWVADLGSQSYGNPVVAGGMVFVNSGYSRFGGMAGNVLLAFAPR